MAAAVECVVIGGGVVGLACARRAALSGLEVRVIVVWHHTLESCIVSYILGCMYFFIILPSSRIARDLCM